ncbi:hypothetical protein B0G62_102632 [Paraburkholderia eburnea]|uniref:Phasin protein n=1 Tax=Paraburkholderia eburnea TaxID=1189126 RepID=A0A2S4MK26_9BURK|nr:hypothetical protein [Paraburkholderia eburnea]POR55021.1 hypothetical protein B0G62_102632 [Paraburkholderia eburnea]PRZ24380.1 hypothetical protein BX588_10398 [Paraburkholderia eburnea]
MSNASHASFNAYRSGSSAVLQWLVHQQQWREQAVNLLQRRTARDRAALEATLESLRGAQSWSDFGAASQTVWRNYLIASAALWQENAAATVQATGVWANAARDAMQQWQDTLAGLQPGAAAATSPDGVVQPMREWMAAFERAMSVATGAAGVAVAASTTDAPAHAHGGQHGR